MRLPIPYPLPPMEARTAEEIPKGDGWQFEPKWDGFRCLVFRDGDEVELQSKSSKPLSRYFPEVVDEVAAVGPGRFVLDAELVVPVEGSLSFDQLLQRIHPAESRVRKLAAEHPGWLVCFDLLAEGSDSLLDLPLEERRPRLETLAAESFTGDRRLRLSPATRERGTAERWFGGLRGVDGVLAKRLDSPYRSGEREGMVKVKRLRTADCVVGGFRYASRGGGIGSLLLGLYGVDGALHHVGFTSSIPDRERERLRRRLEALVEPPGFTGRAPGGPSRWSRGRSTEWEPLRPELVVEVRYDHVSGGRFRHGTKFLRWRPDKSPRQCTFEQVEVSGEGGFALLVGGDPGRGGMAGGSEAPAGSGGRRA